MKRALRLSVHQIYSWCRSSRRVSTLSPLATAFNTRPAQKLNLGFTEKTGLFGMEELKTYDGFFLLKDSVIAETEKLVEESVNPGRSRRMVEIFDELSDTLCRVADLAEFVRLSHPNRNFSLAAEEACIHISGIVEKLNTNRGMYLALKDVVENGDKILTSAVEDHVAALFLFDFEQCGIHLEEQQRQEVVALNDYILQVGQKFMAGALNPRSVPKSSVSHLVRQYLQVDGDYVTVSGLHSDWKSEEVREAAYKIYLKPDAEQEYLLDEMLASRHRLANLCGFPTYGHRALKSSLVGSPGEVKELLEELSVTLRPKAEADLKTMAAIKAELSDRPLAAWDVSFIGNRAKADWLRAASGEFSAYLSLGSCMDGLDTLMRHLYGISLINTPVAPGEVWSSDIYKLAVTHESEGLLGYIYCDFYERPGKPNQDCHFTIRGGRQLPDGTYQNPLVVVMLNLGTARWSGPSLLTPGMVDNLFHEMGHAMHSMLARTQHQHVTGTRCTTDFAEVPSVLMEYFASDPRVLKKFARHYATQEPMPDSMVERLCASKRLFAAADMQVQVFYSMLDQVFHGEPLTKSTTEVLGEIQNKYYSIPYVPNTAWQLRFSHLVGYGAKYYSYLVSRAVASRIWETCFKEKPLCRSSGERYRREVLAHGGGRPPRLLVEDFLGSKASPHSLANALISDLPSHPSL